MKMSGVSESGLIVEFTSEELSASIGIVGAALDGLWNERAGAEWSEHEFLTRVGKPRSVAELLLKELVSARDSIGSGATYSPRF